MRRSQHLRTAVVAALGLVLVGCANSELTAQVEELQAENQDLAQRIEDLEASVTDLRAGSDDSGLEGRVASLEDLMGSLGEVLGPIEDRLGELERQMLDVTDLAETNWSEIDEMRSCVNEYMDTIGRWSSNVNSTYTYYYC